MNGYKKKYGSFAFQYRILDRMNILLTFNSSKKEEFLFNLYLNFTISYSDNLIVPMSKTANVLMGLHGMGTRLLINLEKIKLNLYAFSIILDQLICFFKHNYWPKNPYD
ncbi:hypothetical protein BpHYR1_042954 [Brachionus plicatilis]|uniref:Uncharacterized protein n=1 Tax=Brachionus plicatilis TaxID=10195 RepID=A0A3M7SMR0_BRAPC|nr:hypothetical protein BpHYR1_042954 [Brachionus plicatilis]